MNIQKNDDWRTDVDDRRLLDVVVEFIEERIDEGSERAKLDSVESLSEARRALVMMSRVWGEATNGGLPQFFFNKPDERWHAWAIEAARLMEMPETRKALETGAEIVRELLPETERGRLDWEAYCERVWETFGTRCGSTFWEELDDFERRGAAYIRADPDLSALAPGALEKDAEEEAARRDVELTVTDRERGLLFTAENLRPYLDDFTPDDTREECSMTQSANGTINVHYQYTDVAYGLLIICKVHIHRIEKDAEFWCEAGTHSLRRALGWNLNPRQQVEERNEFFRWGDQSYYSVFTMDGEPSGFDFHARSGVKRFSLMLRGLLFQDEEAVEEAVGPVLDRLLWYEP